MPVLRTDEIGKDLLAEARVFRTEADPEIGFGEAIAASFYQENTVGTLLASNTVGRDFGERDPDYDPRKGKENTVYQYYLEQFAYAKNEEEDLAVRKNIDEQTERRNLLSKGGIGKELGAGLLVGFFDLPTLMPGGVAIKGFRTARTLSSVAVPTVGRAAAGTAAAGFAAGVVTEAVLQPTQETRTTLESVVNIGASTILSAALGAGAGLLSAGRYNAVGQRLNTELDPSESVTIDLGVRADDPISVSAAATSDLQNLTMGADGVVRPTTLAEEGIAEEGKWLANIIAPMNPLLRVLKSESIVARRAIQDIAEMPFALMKNVKGTKTNFAAETEAKLFSAIRSIADREYNTSYEAYRLGLDPNFIRTGKRFLGDITTPLGVLTERQFSDRVGIAMRRADKDIRSAGDPDFIHVPEVERAAVGYREFIKEGKKLLVDSGMVKAEDLRTTTADSYFMRVYDKQKMFDPVVEARMKREFADWLTEIRDKRIIDRDANVISLKSLKKDLRTKETELAALKTPGAIRTPGDDVDVKQDEIFKINDEIIELNSDINGAARDESWISGRSTEIYERIRSAGDTRLEYEMNIDSNNLQGSGMGTRGPAKRRDFLIPDERIADILVDDVREVVKMYDRSVGIDAALFKRFGTFDLVSDSATGATPTSSIARKVTEDYRVKMDEVREAGGDAKAIKKLEDQKDSDLRTLQAIVDRLRGTVENNPSNAGWKRAGAVARSWNYIRLLGGMTLSALADVGNVVMKEGMRKIYGQELVNFAAKIDGIEMARGELRLAGLGLDDINSGRSPMMEGIDASNRTGQSFVENTVHGMARGFSKVALMTQWNNKMKTLAGMGVQARMMEAFEGTWTTLSKKNRNKLARSGIGENEFEIIKRNLEGNVEKRSSGILLPNTNRWNQPDADVARELFRGAIRRDVDIMIVTPGQEIPIWMSSEAGKFFTQFKSFAVSSTSRTMLTALQDKDMNTLMGMMVSTTLGTLSYILKTKAAGKELDLSEDNLLREGIDRSGMLGVLPELNGVLEKMDIGFGRVTGGKELSRFESRNLLGQILGPSSGTFRDFQNIVTSLAADGVLKKSDTDGMKRLTPYQNVFYTRWLTDKAKEGLDSSLGIRK